jgi:hypothetical protein
MELFSGQVLPGARASTSNANTTGDATSGVSRAVFTSDPTQYPGLVVTDIQGARYRSVLLSGNVTYEYLLWANTSGPLVVAPGTTSTNGTVTIPVGTLTVGAYQDGTPRVVLTDDGGANVTALNQMRFVRGGTTTTYTFSGADFTLDTVSGTVTLNATANVRTAVGILAPAPVAVSSGRGDTFTSVTYTPGAATFNWTRNDPGATRFGWNGAHQKWEPYKGGAIKGLDRLTSSGRYTLTPVPTTAVGQYLPGTDTTGDYAMVRLGSAPNETAYPVVYRTVGDYSGLLVVTEDLANTSYDFNSTTPPLAGVVSNTTGKIAWNTDFVTDHNGEYIWYSHRSFESASTGVVGSVLDTLFLAPIPGPTDRPLLSIGHRAPLLALLAENETDLTALTVPSGSVGVTLSTGRVKLNALDIAKANPTSGSFDRLYLGANLRYEGLALNKFSQPVQAPVQLTVVGNDLYIPGAVGLPGTGISGLVQVPDGTGNTPDPMLTVTPRPQASGLVERVTPGFGDAFLFTATGRIA